MMTVQTTTPDPLANPGSAEERTLKPSPAFQFYPADFLADEQVVSMTLAERGLFITLLCHAWREGSIPSDLPAIARLVREPIASIRKLWGGVGLCFFDRGDGRLVHQPLEEIREKQIAYRDRQAQNGRRGGRPTSHFEHEMAEKRKGLGFPQEKGLGSFGIGPGDADSAEVGKANESSLSLSSSLSSIYVPNGTYAEELKSDQSSNGKTNGKPQNPMVAPSLPPDVDFGDLEQDVACYLANAAGENKNGKIAESRRLSLRRQLWAVLTELNNRASFRFGLQAANAKGAVNPNYVKNAARNADNARQPALRLAEVPYRQGSVLPQ